MKMLYLLVAVLFSSYLSAMDYRDNQEEKCLRTLDAYIVERGSKDVLFDINQALTTENFAMIDASKRSIVFDQSQNGEECLSCLSMPHFQSPNKKSIVFYKKQGANNSLDILHKDGTSIHLYCKYGNSARNSIRAISFNKDGNKLAAISTDFLFVWDLSQKSSSPVWSFDIKKLTVDSELLTCCAVALNDSGNILATHIQYSDICNTNISSNSHSIWIMDHVKNLCMYAICLEATFPKNIFFLDEDSLVCAFKDKNSWKYHLKEGGLVINQLNEQQKALLFSIYNDWCALKRAEQEAGVYYFLDNKVKLEDDQKAAINTFPVVVQDWIATMAQITKEECVIS